MPRYANMIICKLRTMKRLLLPLLLAAAPAFAADVGVSVSIGQPGFYGRIDIGGYPPPRVVYAEPVIIHRPPPHVVYEPVYLRVPPGHARNWGRYCQHYNYCGRPVYFVQDDWYRDEYAPRHRPPDWDDRGDRHERPGHGRGHDHGHGRGRD